MEAFTEGYLPVGLLPDAEYRALRMKLQPNDTIVLFSDGVTETMDPQEELFGVERLREILNGKSECQLEQIQANVMDSIQRFARGSRQTDDITLLVLRFRAAIADQKHEPGSDEVQIASASAGG
jgi:sigma-B regulation protein RsbU (phosphoserine phosphatase)